MIDEKVIYDLLKTGQTTRCKTELSKMNYTDNSVNTRLSKRLQIFSDGMNIEALSVIIDSSKVEVSAREDALKILHSELGI